VSDGIQLIHSDGYGNPGGTHLHWVRVTSNPSPHPVNQLTDGGQWVHSDCGEACIESTLRDRGITASVPTIEHDAGATSQGTSSAGLVRALADLRVSATFHTGTLGPGYVMNPLGGRVIAPSGYAAYKAASANQFVAITTPEPWDNVDMSLLSEQQTDQLWHAVFGPTAVNGGTAGVTTPGNNIDIIRRKLSGYARGYPAANGADAEPVEATVSSTGATLTAAQAAALAEIPTILAILQRIEAAAKTA
jgi:hypothetical protein